MDFQQKNSPDPPYVGPGVLWCPATTLRKCGHDGELPLGDCRNPIQHSPIFRPLGPFMCKQQKVCLVSRDCDRRHGYVSDFGKLEFRRKVEFLGFLSKRPAQRCVFISTVLGVLVSV